MWGVMKFAEFKLNRVKKIFKAWQQETDRRLSKALGNCKPENKAMPNKSIPVVSKSLRSVPLVCGDNSTPAQPHMTRKSCLLAGAFEIDTSHRAF